MHFKREYKTEERLELNKIQGTKNKKKNHQISETDSVPNDETAACAGEEAFDLADLDLSRLRLSKQDLETLSGITPELPKHFQEQLLAKLRPNQARKLSRTLSMRNDSHLEPIKVYKRSLSGGQDIDDLKYANNNTKSEYSNGDLYKENKYNNNNDHNNKILQKSDSRARSRTRFDNENDSKSRNSSVCRSSDDFTQSFCSQHSSEVNGKYKYYSPYLDQKCEIERAISPKKYSGSSSPQSICISPAKDLSGRPPSGCLSPPPVACDNSLRKRTSQKRISRFLRPDFYDLPPEESVYVRRRKEQERETQSVLREIREKSLDRTSERLEEIVNEIRYNDRKKRQESLPRDLLSYEPYSSSSYSKDNLGYSNSRISSRDKFTESSSSALDELRRHRRSLSRPREYTEDYTDTSTKAKRVNQILQELQDTSANIIVEKNQIRSSSVQPPEKITNEKITKDLQPPVTKDLQPVTNVKPITEENGSDAAKPTTTKVKTKKSNDSIGKKSSKLSKKQNSAKDETVSIAKPSLNELSTTKSTSDADESKKEAGIKLRPKPDPSKDLEKKVIDSSKTNGVGIQNATTNQENETGPVEEECSENCRSVRPKSYPNSKIAVSKDLRNSNYTSAIGGIINSKLGVKKEEKPSNKSVVPEVVSSALEEKTVPVKIVDEVVPTVEVKIKLKKVSKSKQETVLDPIKADSPPAEDNLNSNTIQVKEKEKCVEKKTGKGILHAIGQKFEKLCETARSSKDKKANTNTITDSTLLKDDKTEEEIKSAVPVPIEKSSIKSSPLKKKKPKVSAESLEKPSTTSNNGEAVTTTEKTDKKSRVDQMIRTLRERSVPRMPAMTESGLIKRAVSVEDMPGSFNKCSVNKVLGLFKKFEKDGGTEKKILNTQSTSNIEALNKNNTTQKQRPKSIGFVSKLRKNNTFKSTDASNSSENSKIVQQQKPIETDLKILANKRASEPFLKNIICTDCNQEALANSKITGIGTGVGVPAGCQMRETESSPNNKIDLLKYKRKSLTLDCSKYHDMTTDQRRNVTVNGNIMSDIGNNSSSYETNNKNNNNNMNNGTENHELNQNFLPLMYKDNLTNSSSDCKSLHDDCTLSTSLRSPTEEPELCFDNWSICSDDNNSTMNIHSPTNLSSKASRASQFSPPSSVAGNNEPSESVIDRIKRRSFYCRFNEKKPKRQSNIVSPAAREYYRETQAKRLSRPPDRLSSPELKTTTTTKSTGISTGNNISSHHHHHHHHHHHDYDYRPPPPPSVNYDKTGDNTKTYNIKLTDSNNLRTNYNNVLSSKSIGSSTKRPVESDIFRSRHHITSSYEPSCCSSYSTYNSYSRPPSSHLNGLTSSQVTSRNIDSYATLNRRIRPYDQRSISLLTPSSQGISTVPSSLDVLRRDHQRNNTTELGNLPRSNLRVRTSSLSRSPTKI